MRNTISLASIFIVLLSCYVEVKRDATKAAQPLQGTWKLLTGTLIGNCGITFINQRSCKKFPCALQWLGSFCCIPFNLNIAT